MVARAEATERKDSQGNSSPTIQPYPGARQEGSGVVIEKYVSPESIDFSRDSVAENRERKALDGKIIVVLGAGPSGIGGSAAREAAAQGATVIASSRKEPDSPEAERLIADLVNLGSKNSRWIRADISNNEDRQRLIGDIYADYGRIDGLIIASAVLDDDLFIRMGEERIRKAFETNLFGPLFVIQSAIDNMSRKQKPRGGKITIISSLAATLAPYQAAYGIPKAGLDNAIVSLAEEYKGRISFSAVSPGLVDTQMTSHLSPDQKTAILQMTTAARQLLPQEVAELAVFLVSPDSDSNGKLVSIIGKGKEPDIDDRNLIPDDPSFRPASQKPEYIRLNTKWIRRAVSPDYVQRAKEAEEQMVLDLGCSVGNNTRPIRDIFEEEGIKATIIGGDIDDTSLRIARKEVTGKGNVRVNFEHVDATDMPFQPETFDKIFLWNMWQEIPDRQGAMFQVARVVKPEGEVEILTSFTDRAYPSSHDGMMLGRLKRKTKEILGIEEKGNRVDESRFKPIVIEEAIGMIREAGLEIDDNPNLEENADISIETEELSPEFIEAMAGDIKFNEGFFEDIPDAMNIPFWRRRDALIQATKEKKAEAEAKGQEYIFNRNWVLFRARKPETSTVSRADTTAQGPTVPLESTGSIY